MKRSLIYFVIYFIVSFVTGFLVSFGGQTTGLSVFYASAALLLPIFTFLFSYLYFRKSKNDWSDRLFTLVSWTIAFVILSTALAQPVYGYLWTQMVSVDVLMGYWIVPACILAAGVVAPRSPFTNPL